MADNVRSIPSVCDGLKPGQRKVIWGCFKRKLKKEIKVGSIRRGVRIACGGLHQLQVAQLVGYISEHAAYHHGEQSLTMTIVNLAQDYVGSNNLNLLLPNGQFGTRDQGGKDHASARYIFTEPAPVTRAVFHPDDDPLLNYLKDDNDIIEPEHYLPVLPMLLINGAEGIGTGWSTNVPCYNPEDIIANIRLLMDGKEQVPMLPWWRGFRGAIKKVAEHKYDVTGIVKKINDTTVEIVELPIHKWTQSYKAELEAMIGEKGDGPVKVTHKPSSRGFF
jgi:DNA topoisomerase-2